MDSIQVFTAMSSAEALEKRCKPMLDVADHILKSLEETISSMADELIGRTKTLDDQIKNARGRVQHELIKAKSDSQKHTKHYVTKLKRQIAQWKDLLHCDPCFDGSIYYIGGYCVRNAPVEWRDTMVQGRRSGPIVAVDNWQQFDGIKDETVYVFLYGFEAEWIQTYYAGRGDKGKKVNVLYHLKKIGVEISPDRVIKLLVTEGLDKSDSDQYRKLDAVTVLTPYKRAKRKPPDVSREVWPQLKGKPFIRIYDMFAFHRVMQKAQVV